MAKDTADAGAIQHRVVPVLLKAKAFYILGKCCFFENRYADSVMNYQTVLDLLEDQNQFDS